MRRRWYYFKRMLQADRLFVVQMIGNIIRMIQYAGRWIVLAVVCVAALAWWRAPLLGAAARPKMETPAGTMTATDLRMACREASERVASTANGAPSMLELLRKQPEMYLRDLPENIRIPALDGNRPDEVVRRLEDATIDDLAFAIQGMESESRLIHRRLSGLRDLYEMARKRGALGVTTVADAFANISTEEAGK